MNSNPKRLAIFVAFSGQGGVERAVLNLLQGFSTQPIEVDLVAVVGKYGWLPAIPWPNVRVVELGVKHTHLALPGLVRYLRAERPDVLMAAKDRAVRIAVLARWLARVDTRLVGQLHSSLLGLLATKTSIQRWLRTAPMRWLFPYVDQFICVSDGVAKETMQMAGIPHDRFIALPNPIITPEVYEKAQLPSGHPWLDEPGPPVILGAGRLAREKNFATLIRAFEQVSKDKDCRLVILGEGPLRGELERLVAELGLNGCVSLPGYAENPFAFMKRASLFALSSDWEGSGNVLIEAMALGTPVVSTACDGPSEILAGGKYGALVPIGDFNALAEAMLETMRQPLSAALLQEGAEPFSVTSSARRYLEAL